MWHVFRLQWQRLLKEPMLVLTFLGLTIAFVFFLGQGQVNSTIHVPVYSTELSEVDLEEQLAVLNENDAYQFVYQDEESVRTRIQNNRLNYALQLEANHFRFLIGHESFSLPMVEQYLNQTFYESELLEQNALTDFDVRNWLEVRLETETVRDEQMIYQTQIVVGMTLYFVMYTVLFQMLGIAEEKTHHTWDRLVLSPLSKVGTYTGLSAYYTLLGIIQILISFFIFSNLLGFSFGENLLLLISVVALFIISVVSLGLMLVSFVKTTQQLQAVIPIVATATAMLGGAFWPIEFVTNPILIGISRVIPIRYGIEVVSAVIRLNEPWAHIAQPILILVMLTLLFGGVGFYNLEKKR